MKATALLTVILLLMAGFPISHADGGVDIGVRWVKVNANAGEGEIVEIRARVDNLGSGTVPPFNVSFYHDSIDERNLIGKKHYDSINVYRLPSVSWDTKGFAGNHTIMVLIDLDDENMSNNRGNASMRVFDTHPGKDERKVIITEVYYHAHPNQNNEYICICNPSPGEVNIYGWYLTKDPWKRADEQTKIVFPNMFMEGNRTICVTQNASSLYREARKDADFEYYDCSPVPDMERHGSFVMSNEGGIICLKDLYNHTIDTVIYGNRTFNGGWDGKPVDTVPAGRIMERKFDGTFMDTNSSRDWKTSSRIGGSDFLPFRISATGNATLFSSPDSSFREISSEIENASKSIYLNMYEFTNPLLCDAVCRALERNVSVTVLLEGQPAGGLGMEERYVANEIYEHGGKVFYMAGDSEKGIYRRYAFDHAKYAVIDNETCIIQSANWGKAGVPASNTFGNREWGIVVENGSLADFLLDVFGEDMNYTDVIPFRPSDFLYGKPPPEFFMDESIPEGNYKPSFYPAYVNGTFNFTVILSPDNAEREILKLLDSAGKSIFIEQLYIQKEWDGTNPFLSEIVNKSRAGVDVRVIMNYNPRYESTDRMNEETALYLKQNGIDVKFVYSNWSYFTNVHNKGIVVDGNKTLISSINWNENSVRNNREMGIIVESEYAGKYFTKIFNYDWNLSGEDRVGMERRNYDRVVDAVAVIAVFSIAFLLIYFHWRRK